MKIMYILNARSSSGYLEKLSCLLGNFARLDVELTVRDIPDGPPSIETGLREAQVFPKFVEAIVDAGQDFDGIVIGCFLDPAIHIARELVEVPVVGIGQAGLQMAAAMGTKTGVLAGMSRLVPSIETMIANHGMDGQVSAVYATNLTVAELREKSPDTIERVQAAISHLIEEKYVDVIVGGCGSFGEVFREIRHITNVPLIDSRVAAIKQIEALVDMYRFGEGKTSRVGLYKNLDVCRNGEQQPQ